MLKKLMVLAFLAIAAGQVSAATIKLNFIGGDPSIGVRSANEAQYRFGETYYARPASLEVVRFLSDLNTEAKRVQCDAEAYFSADAWYVGAISNCVDVK